MFARRTSRYADDAAGESDALDERMKTKLATDLRAHIRSILQHAVFSADWLRVNESLRQVSLLALIEEKLPDTQPAIDGVKSETTLWEREQLSVRFMLEEGKLNVCVHLMRDFKAVQRSLTRKPENLGAVAKQVGRDEASVQTWVNSFEQNLGLLLRCALAAIESLQTCDMSLLILHCAEVLSECYHFPKNMSKLASYEWTQEILVLQYLGLIARNLESLDEERVLQVTEEQMIFPMIVVHLHRHHTILPQRSIVDALQYLSLVADTEAFSTHVDRYLRNDDEQRMLVDLDALLVKPLLKQRPDLRKSLVDLNTAMRRLGYQLKRKASGTGAATNDARARPSSRLSRPVSRAT